MAKAATTKATQYGMCVINDQYKLPFTSIKEEPHDTQKIVSFQIADFEYKDKAAIDYYITPEILELVTKATPIKKIEAIGPIGTVVYSSTEFTKLDYVTFDYKAAQDRWNFYFRFI